MVGKRRIPLQLVCFAAAAVLVAASCGGSKQSTSVDADELTERTLGPFDSDATTAEPPTGSPVSEGPDETTPLPKDGSGGAVPKPSGDSPAAPTKDKPTSGSKSEPNEAKPATPKEAPQPAPVPNDGSTSSIEREIASLTNELRANPNGRLKRSNSVRCDGTPIDPATGQARPAPALTFDSKVSTQMARDWSQKLTWAKMQSRSTAHRPNQDALYSTLGISPRVWSENVVAIPSPSATAMQMFTEWRDSDGHYCNLMNPSVTHIGVGVVVKDSSKGQSTFATQNFYAAF